MVELWLVGFVAGIVAGISPCVLPVLPVVLFAGSAPGTAGAAPLGSPAPRGSPPAPAPRPSPWRARSRPVAVVAGLVASFSFIVLAGSAVLSALGLPQDLLRDLGVALLVLVGLSFLVPPWAALLERPFSRIAARRPRPGAGGFLVGVALGPLFVPCAGPVLAALTVVGATHRVGWAAVGLTVAFAAGAGTPLLAVALAGGALVERVRALRRRAPRIRQVGGAVLVVMAVAIGLNAFAGLQRDVPGYTSALQNGVEGGAKVRRRLDALTGNRTAATADLAGCNANATGLVNCGKAPAFQGITAWLNTPGGRPLTLAGLRGKVVLVDFWTYSCINCQRALPHVEAWYADYARDGFVVVGVHTPEFSFEHVVSNVAEEAGRLGVRYPVAVDDAYRTWDAYDNEYWPADYLIDAHGYVRHVHFGEGDYAGTERLIRRLLVAAHPHRRLPPPTEVPDRTPTGAQSPETYVGYAREQFIVNPSLRRGGPARYRLPTVLPYGSLALGGTWTDRAEEATAGPGARLELGFAARDVYLVMAGSGRVEVSLDHRALRTVAVGGVPRLYTLVRSATASTGTLELSVSPGIQVYDFTFG